MGGYFLSQSLIPDPTACMQPLCANEKVGRVVDLALTASGLRPKPEMTSIEIRASEREKTFAGVLFTLLDGDRADSERAFFLLRAASLFAPFIASNSISYAGGATENYGFEERGTENSRKKEKKHDLEAAKLLLKGGKKGITFGNSQRSVAIEK